MLPDTIYVGGRKYLMSGTLPAGYSLYQMGDDFQALGGARACAVGGCPAVVPLPDERTAGPDTIFTEQWQYYVYAINMGMTMSSIIALMGDGKALFNNTGFGNPDKPVNNYLTGRMGDKDPRLDKLRSFCLNTHAFIPVGDKLQLLTMNGSINPPLKPGRTYPSSVAEINPDDYLYLPQTHRWLFLDCSNVKWKKVDLEGNFLAYGPFDNGIQRAWIGDGKMHSFFPLVSTRINYCPAGDWNRVVRFPSPFRQPTT